MATLYLKMRRDNKNPDGTSSKDYEDIKVNVYSILLEALMKEGFHVEQCSFQE